MSSPAQEVDRSAPTPLGTPSSFLQTVVGNRVLVRLNSGVSYHGILNCLDGYMNIALENTEEWVGGRKTNEFGDAFVRGNNDGLSGANPGRASVPRVMATRTTKWHGDTTYCQHSRRDPSTGN
ncbi:BZ3500_MvSof-1268-A1-R1_Chr4-1g06793 [Microbotryum saponariae]|uniref:U6 snRNA-associated Sm-like protein LSm6 n=1 Tax=Microbotryum saponariae TaxID=289078 RepID=A0A2X0MR92_9BASI|nr:BZ3500_MvSof-1268-A1-R1_Chr4-1g06793 [Microbotryum saponariae]SDA06450.1 BZ3501_MvSof-1269-A2-R1_Chr4-1g06495 [Microbotryum saponariae]